MSAAVDAPWIYVRGAGGVGAHGCSLDAIAASLAEGAAGFRGPAGEEAAFPAPFDLRRDLPRGLGRRIGRQPALVLSALLEAVGEDVAPSLVNSTDLGLFLGTANGAMHPNIEFVSGVVRHGPRYASPMLFAGSLHNAMAGVASRAFGIRGPSIAVSNGPTSFESALVVALTQLRLDHVRRALVGASDSFHPFYARALAEYGALSSSAEPPRGLDVDAPLGLHPGEAAGALLLETGSPGGSGVRIIDVAYGSRPPVDAPPVGRVVVLSEGSGASAARHLRALRELAETTEGATVECLRECPVETFGTSGSTSALAVAIEAHARLAGAPRTGATVFVNAPYALPVVTVWMAGSGS